MMFEELNLEQRKLATKISRLLARQTDCIDIDEQLEVLKTVSSSIRKEFRKQLRTVK